MMPKNSFLNIDQALDLEAAIIILRFDGQDKFYFKYVSQSFADLFNVELVDIIDQEVNKVFTALPSALYDMAYRVALKGGREKMVIDDNILHEPIYIKVYRSDLSHCTLFIQKYSHLKNRENEILRLNAFEMMIEEGCNVVLTFHAETNKINFHKIDSLFWNLQSYQNNIVSVESINDFIHPDDQAMMKNLVREVRKQKLSQADVRLKSNNGEYIWVDFSLFLHQHEEFNRRYILGIIKNIDKKKKLEAKLKRQAELDSLTELYNRGTIELLINRNLKRKTAVEELVAVILIDMDNFRDANNHYGHLYGDQVLIAFSKLLNHHFKDKGLIARVGGDEFLIYLESVKSKQELDVMIKRLLNCNAKMIIEPHGAFRISASIGTVVAKRNESDFSSLYQSSDIALYRAKAYGGNTHVAYTDQIDEAKIMNQSSYLLSVPANEEVKLSNPFSKFTTNEKNRISRLMKVINKEFDFDRSYLVLDKSKQEQIIAHIEHSDESSLVIDWREEKIYQELQNNKIAYINHTDQEDLKYKKQIRKQNIEAVVLLGLTDEEEMFGYIGFEDLERKREFSELDQKKLMQFGLMLSIILAD